MLLCGIINDLEKISGINLSYFFCQATDSRINSAKAVVGGLLRFFLGQRRQLLGHVFKKFEDKLDQLIGPNAWEVLCEIFKEVSDDPSLPDPICIVDALDECEQDVRPLLNLIVNTSSRIKWLVSSRNIQDIERKFQSIDPSRKLSLELGGNAIDVTRSVDAYINRSIQTIEALKVDEDLRVFTTNILKSKANGTYLWVSLVVGQLQDTAPRNVKGVLEEMPEGLERLYGIVMTQSYKRLSRKDREAYPMILSTMATAKRPLSLEELLIFIKLQWKSSDNINNTHDVRDMIKDCGVFLSIRDDTIFFVHQSAKDYLTQSSDALNLIFPQGIAFQHSKMAEMSLHGLSNTLTYNIYNLKEPEININDLSPPTPDPLAPIAYCCVFWVEHLVHSCESNESESNKSRSEELFKDNGIIHSFLEHKFLCWLEALALLRKLMPQGLNAVYKLRRLAIDIAGSRQGSEMNYLKAFMDDAYRFLLRYEYSVQYRPLQLYYSAMVFDDKRSIIYKTFRQTMHAEFPDVPTITSGPQSQFSLQQVLKLDFAQEDREFYSLRYSPDSTLLGYLSWTSSLPSFWIWKTNSGALERVIEMHTDEKCKTKCPDKELDCYVAFTPDSKYLISVSSTGVVQKWAINSGCRIQRCSLPLRARVYSFQHETSWGEIELDFLQDRVVALSQNGDLIASTHRTSSSGVSSVKVWSTETGDCSFEIKQSVRTYHKRFYTMISVFSPDSALLALIDESNIRIYCTQTGKEVHRLAEKVEMRPGKGTSSTTSAKFSPDSQILARTNHNAIDVFEIETWKKLRCNPYDSVAVGEGFFDFDFSPDSSTIMLLPSESRYSMLWSIVEEKCLLMMPAGEEFTVTFSPHRSTSSFDLAFLSGEDIQLLRVNINDILANAKVQISNGSLTISPDSKYLACFDEEHNVMIWSADSGICIQVLQGDDRGTVESDPVYISYLNFSPNSEFVACREKETGDVRIWRICTGQCIHLYKGNASVWTAATFSPDSKIIAYTHGTSHTPYDVSIWHISTEKFSHLINGCEDMAAEFSDDSRYLFLREDDEFHIWVYCMESDQCVYQYKCQDKEKGGIGDMKMSSDSKYIALAFGRGAEVQVLDWRTALCISSFNCNPSTDCYGLAFSSDSAVMAVFGHASDGIKAQIWQVTTSLRLAVIAVEGYDLSGWYHKPLSGLASCINTRFGTFFREESSWKLCDKTLQPRYHIQRTDAGGTTWLHLGRQRICLIPYDLMSLSGRYSESNSLIAYVNDFSDLMIVKLPNGEKEGEEEEEMEEMEKMEED